MKRALSKNQINQKFNHYVGPEIMTAFQNSRVTWLKGRQDCIFIEFLIETLLDCFLRVTQYARHLAACPLSLSSLSVSDRGVRFLSGKSFLLFHWYFLLLPPEACTKTCQCCYRSEKASFISFMHRVWGLMLATIIITGCETRKKWKQNKKTI